MADSKYRYESDTLACVLTKGAQQVGDTIEGNFTTILHRWDEETDTVHVTGDFRLRYDRDYTKE